MSSEILPEGKTYKIRKQKVIFNCYFRENESKTY